MNEPDICQVCKKNFVKGDDVVVCPVCGAPYHRACYQEAGSCVYTDKHAEGFEYRPSAPPKPEQPAFQQPGAGASQEAENEAGGVICPNCKTINESSHIFCERCGHPLHEQNAAGAQNTAGFGAEGAPGQGNAPFFGQEYVFGGTALQGAIDEIPQKDWAAFIGTSVPIYMARMEQQNLNKTKLSFTFSAFFVPEFYFAYRKMWLWAAVAVLVSTVLQVPFLLLSFLEAGVAIPAFLTEDFLLVANTVASWATIVMKLASGTFALYLYRRDAGKKIRALQESAPPAYYQQALRHTGGVSVLAVVVVVVLFFLLGFLISMYGGDAFGQYLLQEYMPAL